MPRRRLDPRVGLHILIRRSLKRWLVKAARAERRSAGGFVDLVLDSFRSRWEAERNTLNGPPRERGSKTSHNRPEE